MFPQVLVIYSTIGVLVLGKIVGPCDMVNSLLMFKAGILYMHISTYILYNSTF